MRHHAKHAQIGIIPAVIGAVAAVGAGVAIGSLRHRKQTVGAAQPFVNPNRIKVGEPEYNTLEEVTSPPPEEASEGEESCE